eukprot:1735744-Pyramimonas_sp.AAC.1
MMPKDLVMKSGGAVAWLEQGPLEGSRITRHGQVHCFKEVKGSSHRRLWEDLEATRDEDGIGM